MRKRVTLFQIENLNQNRYLHLLIYDMHVLEMGQEQLVDRMSERFLCIETLTPSISICVKPDEINTSE